MRRDERHHTMKSTKTADDDKTSVTSAVKTVNVAEEDGGGAAVTEFSVWNILLHPTSIPKMILQSVAGSYWPACRRQLSMLPLKFNDPKMEQYYVNYCAAKHPFRMYISCATFVVAAVIAWVLITIAEHLNWFELANSKAMQLNHVASAVAVGSNLIFMICLWYRKPKILADNVELVFYGVQIVCTSILALWGTWAIYKSYQLEPFRRIKKVIDQKLYVFGFPLHVIYSILYAMYSKWFYELKMLADAVTTALFFTQIILVDAYLDTKSSWSFWFHIIMIGMFALTRGLQIPSLYVDQLLAANILDIAFITLVYLVGWLARWFRELQERSNIVRVQESQLRLESVKERVKKRGVGTSAAEEILDILRQTSDHIKEVNKLRMRKGSGPNTLLEVIETIQAAQEMLAQVDVKKEEAEEPSVDPTKADDELKEDAFINMFNLDKRAGAVAAARKPRATGTGAAAAGTVRWLDETEEAAASKKTVTIADVEVTVPLQMEKIGRQVGDSLDLRILEHAAVADNIVMDVGYILLSPFKAFLDTTDRHLLCMLYGIYRNHWSKNPYHSSVHGANVAHICMCLVNTLGMADSCQEEQLIALILSGLGHSIGHSGRNNIYYIQSDSLLTLLQNDNAVLENIQCFMLQRLITSCEETNILANLSHEEFVMVRKFMIEFILALDMSKHFELISKSRVRRASPEFDIMNNDRDMVLQILFKVADLGHTILEWPQHLEWTLRLQEEYYQQGADEVEKGMSISSPLCDRNLHNTAFSKNQSGYMSLIVLPMVQEIINYDPTNPALTEANTRALFNKQKWDGLRDSKKSPPITVQDQIPPAKYTHWVMFNLIKCQKFADACQQPTAPMMARI